jgi:hypothetical protein
MAQKLKGGKRLGGDFFEGSPNLNWLPIWYYLVIYIHTIYHSIALSLAYNMA